MTTCEYRFDCWHEDTCNAQDQALVRPGCWKEKGEGWKPEPDSGMVRFIEQVSKVVKENSCIPKSILEAPLSSEYIDASNKLHTNCQQLSTSVDETEQGELF